MSKDQLRIGRMVRWVECGNPRVGRVIHANKYPMILVHALEGDKPFVEASILSIASMYDVESWAEVQQN